MEDITIPIEEIPDQSILPDGAYTVKVHSLEPVHSKAGKLMFKCALRVAEGPFSNMPVFDNFVIGTDNDPLAADNDTWKRFGAVRFKQFLKASRCQLSNSFRQLGAAVIGTELVAVVKTENSDQYGPQNRVARYAARGEVDTQVSRPAAQNSAAGLATPSGGGFE